MGFEDWENRYTGRTKPQLRDFLDEDEKSDILGVGRSPPQQTPVRQNTQQSGFLPATYPEGYDTIDRRRKKRIRDPGDLHHTEADKMKEVSPSDLALPHKKRGEVFLRQVAELQEEEERTTSCLRPYKDGLLYKTRMWAKNQVDNTLENYVAYKKAQDARRKAQFEFQSAEDLQYSIESEEEIDGLPFAEEDFPPEFPQHYQDRFSYFDGHLENGPGLREKKCAKAKIGGWATDAMLSPVEEPSDEYVDTMDELQCLVESVSEYLAEKEEEISRYGSLPMSSKSRLSSQGSNRTASFGEEQNYSSNDPREEPCGESHTSSDPSVSGVKNAMSSLLSSITKGVGGGIKKPVPSPPAPCAPPPQSGLTKLLSFIPKSSSSTPVAVVSPVESSPEQSFSSLPSQTSHHAKMQGHSQKEIPLKSQPQTNPKKRECESKSQSTPQNSALGKLNPLNLFSSGDNVNLTPGWRQSDETHPHKGGEVTTGGGVRKSDKKLWGQKPDEIANSTQNSTNYNPENGPSAGPARSADKGQTANIGLFSPLKKSLSSLITPITPITPVQPQVPVAVYPVFRATEDPAVANPPFRSPDNMPAQQNPKAQGGPCGFQKFPSSEHVGASVPTQTRVASRPNSTAFSSLMETSAVPQENSERSWFSSIFNPTSDPLTVNKTFPSDKNPQNSTVQSGSHVQHNQKPAAAESQSFLTGLFKGHSAEDISLPKQGGLLSGLLKFGSTSDISAEATSSYTQRNSNPPQNPTEPCSSLPQCSEVQRQRNISQETSQEDGKRHQQTGLVSGLLKFASSENISSSQPIQQREENNLYKTTQGPNSGSQQINRHLSQQDRNPEMSKPGFPQEKMAPIQQPTSQQSGILSGFFKFASSDNIKSQKQSTSQQSHITTSNSSHEETGARNILLSSENQPQSGSTPKTSGLLSGLFKSSSENVAQQQQSRGSQELQQQQSKDLSNQSAEVQVEKSGVLSGLLNKFTKSSENPDTTCQIRASSDQSLQQRAGDSAVRAKTEHEHETKDRAVSTPAPRGFLTGLLNKVGTAEPSNVKQVQTSCNHTQQIPSTKWAPAPSGLSKSVSTDFGQNICPTLVSGSFNQRHSRHTSIGGPVTVDSGTLDLRTSATFARSLQSQSRYSSVSTGNLPQLWYSSSLQTAHPGAYSIGNIPSLVQHQTSPIMSTHPMVNGSSSSLFEMDNPHQGQLSPYRASPSYDENQWIQESVFWQQFQNESVNFQVHGGDQVQRQIEEGSVLQGSPLCHSLSNIYQPYNSSTQPQGAFYQEQIGTYPTDVRRNVDPLSKKRLWSSYEDLGNSEYTPNDYGVLNLTTNQSNGMFGKWHSFNNESSYSLNGVSYHEGYYEEMPPNLSYSANWHYGMDDAVQQNFQNEFQNQFTSNRLTHSSYLPTAPSETDSLYLQDTEWYQQWLSLLEQGMWWPAEDGDCGYFVYTDHEYIYALLTDAAGEYVYVCTPEGESWGDTQRDGFPSAWLHNEMVCVCGFKIPLYNEDELLWLPGQHNGDPQLLNAPLDLSAAYKKGNQIMNLNLEQFSEMFENSFLSQCRQDIDFTSYTLNKVKMGPRQPSYVTEDQGKDIIDLSCHSKYQLGSNWNRREIKTLLSQKVAVSLNSSPTPYPNHQLLHNCYQPSQRRRSTTGVTVKHVDDVLEEEWRKRVSPGEEIPNRQVQKISSLISSFASKAPQGEVNKLRPSSDQKSKNILSTGLQSLKSKIIKDEPAVVVTESQSVKQPTQKKATVPGRTLPPIPTAAQVSQLSGQSHPPSQKNKLSRQSTVEHQATPAPAQPHVPLGPKSFIKTGSTGQVTTNKTTDISEEKPSEQSQTGLMNFLKSAVRIEEPKFDSQMGSQTSLHQQSKTGNTSSFQGSAPSNKEATGVSNIFGSIGSLFSSDSSSPQTQIKPSFTERSLASVNTPRGIQRQQTLKQSGLSQPTESRPPNKSVSQVFQAPRPSTGLATSKSETLPPTEQSRNESGVKPSSGIFGFSLGEMLSGSTTAAQSGTVPHTASNSATQEESIGKSLLLLFSGPNQNQSSPSSEPRPQVCQSQTDSQPSQPESAGKGLLSLFGGSSFSSHPPQTKPPAEVTQQGTVPPKDPANTGFLSIFSSPSAQQSQSQTGSLLGGLLPGSSGSTESPVKGLFSMFGDPTPSPNQPPTSGTAQSRSQQQASQPESKPQVQYQAQGHSSASVLGGILGGLSSSNESPRKSLFSMFSSPESTPSSGTARNTDLSAHKGATVPKEPANKPVCNDVLSSQQGLSSPLGTVPTSKEPPKSSFHQGSSEISSASSSHVSVPDVSCKISTVVNKPVSDSTVNGATQATDAGCIGDQNKIGSQSSSLNVPPSEESHVSSILPGSGLQTPSDATTSPSVVGPSSEVPAPEPSGLKDPPIKSLFSVFGGSANQPSPQSGSSLLGAMFGGSSAQPTTSQTGGSLLGGLFAGPAPPPSAPMGGGCAPQTAGPPSLLGGLFGGSTTQAAGSQTASSILGGLFGGSAASTTGPQPSSANQPKPQTSSSMFGGMLGGSSGAGLLGGIFSGTPAANEVPDTSPRTLESAPPSVPLSAPASSSNENKTPLNKTPDMTSDVTPEKNSDNFQAVSVLGSSEKTADNAAQSKAQEEALQQSDGTIPSGRQNLSQVDSAVPEGHLSQKTTRASDLSHDVQAKESDISAQPTCPGEVGAQLNQSRRKPTDEQDKLPTSSVSTMVQEQHLPEPERPVMDSSTDAVKGFVSSLFKPAVVPTEGPQQQQNPSSFGLGGSQPQAANSQAGSSLLGGIFGGSNTETTAPQAGVSILGGLFKGSVSQTPASNTGGSLLGGMFGGGSPATASGQQSGVSVLTGMFGGPASPAQSGGSLLSGIFGGASVQTEAAQSGASVLGSIGGSLFGGIGKTSKPSEPVHVESKPTHSPCAKPQKKNESSVPKLSLSTTDMDTNKSVDKQQPNDPEQPNIQTTTTVVSEPCPETSTGSESALWDPMKNEIGKENSAVEGEMIDVKHSVSKESDPNASQKAPIAEDPSAHAEPPQAKSVFGFISTPTNAGKSLGSLFSPTLSSVPLSMPQSEGGGGLFSGLKTLSGALFQEEKPATGKQEPPTTSLFGTKISFPWQTEVQNAQTSPVIIAQPTKHKPTNGRAHTEQKVTPSDAPKIESVGGADNITTPQICISTPDVDPSATLTPVEKETVLERPPSTSPSSGVQLDNQPNTELLNATRPVEAQ